MGKIIKVNDYKFEYGKETSYAFVYGAFKYLPTGNKYVVYSVDDGNKLFYGGLFVRGNEIVVMIGKEENVSSIVEEFINNLLEDKKDNDFSIINLDKIETIQIIDSCTYEKEVDINLLKDKTIPKPKVTIEKEEVKTKKSPIVVIGLLLTFILIGVFFFFNPDVITGKKIHYLCNIEYSHNKLPALVTEDIDLVFNSDNEIISINISSDYKFSDESYYKEFRDKNYFYQYFSDIDSYKFDDDNLVFRAFSSINTKEDYFMPKVIDELLLYYKNKGYNCSKIEGSE